MKLDLDGDNVFEQSLTVEECRSFDQDTDKLIDKLAGWLDEAQGKVFTGEAKKAYLVIEITK